ncbi:rod shape-determining protein [Aquimarina sp. W85]|uniref:rod shape-determining protein n=1 Tax=Aquimarina rhodophyticola TaxID=3342246 RepID=UPI00366D0682
MRLFDFSNEKIAIDLGTTNTLITCNGKIVVENPSILAINQLTGKIMAAGKDANLMRGKIHKNIKTIYPLKDGMIANFKAAEMMLSSFFKQVKKRQSFKLSASYTMIISIPCGSTDVEIRAVKESVKRLNPNKVLLIPEPVAAAIGSGIDVLQPRGSMVIDIGGGTTEIAVICMGKIISGQSVKIAGNMFNENITAYIRDTYNLHIGNSTAEKIKISVGAATQIYKNVPEKERVRGRDVRTGKPKEIEISHREIAKSIDQSIQQIESAILETLATIPPEISADIYESGIYLTGGGSMLRGLDTRLAKTTNLPVCTGIHPLEAVVKGSAMVVKNISQYTTVLVETTQAY